MMKILAMALALALALSLGCSKSEPSSTASPQAAATTSPESTVTSTPVAEQSAAVSVPEGWSTAQANDGKLKLGLPPGWIMANSDDPELKQTIDELVKNNPGLAGANTKDYYFMAVDGETAESFGDNLNVVKNQVAQTFPMNEETAQLFKAELEKRLPTDGPLEIAPIKLPCGEAIRYSAAFKLAQVDGSPMSTWSIGYMFFHGNDMLVFTFTTAPERKDNLAKTAAQVVETITVLP